MPWQIDPAHSEIQFAIRHLMISTVRGQFEKFTGTVNANEDDPTQSSVEVQIEAASINTRTSQRDEHLRSPDFLNAAQYPYIMFKSKRIDQVDGTHGRIIGDLTIRDVTHEVTLEVEYAGQSSTPWGTTSAGFSAQTRFNRKDWGLNWNQSLETGGVLVGDEVKVSIEIEVVKLPDQVPQAEPAEAVAA